MEKIVIYDTDHPGGKRNLAFDENYMRQSPAHTFIFELAGCLRRSGYEVCTADVFLEKYTRSSPVHAYVITDMISANTRRLLAHGARPFLCFSTESPLIARRFYMNVKKLSGRFLYSMLFRGAGERLAGTGTTFLPMYFPVNSRTALPPVKWEDKKRLVMINRNKRAFFNDSSSLKNIIRSLVSRVLVRVQGLIDPWIRSPEIYRDRIEAISYFSGTTGFELYGVGWEQPIPGFSDKYSNAAKRVYKGTVGDKLQMMSRFKFAICFENCAFPGYVTEKIFDCFLAGCIPIYFGAPDIADFVPPATYIDFRKFNSLAALDEYLQGFTESEAIRMREETDAFLLGKDFDKFYEPNVITKIVDLLKGHELSRTA